MKANKYTQELNTAGVFKMLAMSYEEIAVMRMQQVRQKVLSTRVFIDRLGEVFLDVKANYRLELEDLIKKNRKNEADKLSFSTIAKNGKTVLVLLSANASLYGDIVKRVFEEFKKDASASNSDLVVIGKLGKSFMDSGDFKREYKYFDLKDSNVSALQLNQIINLVINYQHVSVYYGLFQNIGSQLPSKKDLSGDKPPEKEIEAVKLFDFEPSLEYILKLFENHVFTSLFQQTVSEAELSRHASRIKAMEEAITNIERLEKILTVKSRLFKKSLQNKKMLEKISGISLWG